MKRLFLYGMIVACMLVVVFISCGKDQSPLAPQTEQTLEPAAKNAGRSNPNIRLRVFIHYPKPEKGGGPKPPKPPRPPEPPPEDPPCYESKNDQVPDFGLTDWHMPQEGMFYHISERSIPRNLDKGLVEEAILNAFDTWNEADPAQEFVYGGSSSARAAKFDGINLIAWGGAPEGSIAVTYVWYYLPPVSLLVEADTIFNKQYEWAVTPVDGINPDQVCSLLWAFDVQNIGTHEFGHWVGLDDLYDSIDEDLTMYGYGRVGELKKDTLGLGDQLGVLAIAP